MSEQNSGAKKCRKIFRCCSRYYSEIMLLLVFLLGVALSAVGLTSNDDGTEWRWMAGLALTLLTGVACWHRMAIEADARRMRVMEDRATGERHLEGER